jgi:hypothetical protein
MRSFVLLAVAAVVLACLASSHARAPGKKRQFYDAKWTFRKEGNYYYKRFHFKVKKTDTVYKEQVVVYKPKKTKEFVFWYNPESGKYWARCPTVNHRRYGKEVKNGVDYWSILPKEKRKATLPEIKNVDYGEIKQESPPLPECKDDVKIECPPTQLPRE